MNTEWTFRQSLFCLIGSTCLTLSLSVGGYSLWKKDQAKRLLSDAYLIRTIVQTGPEKEALKTDYLAEWLSLSSDRPVHLYALDLKKGEKRLLSSPLIAKAKLKRLPPSALYIDYEARKPVARLSDFENTAIDREGYLFPAAPFFSQKRLPEMYLGCSPNPGSRIESPLFDLALEILRFLETAPWKEGVRIERIDVSNAFAPSLGQREVVLFTEEELWKRKEGKEFVCLFPKIVRLAPKDYSQQLSHFFTLRRAMIADYEKQLDAIQEGGRFSPRIIDLRIPQIAFVERGS